jgi:hypothetical protein
VTRIGKERSCRKGLCRVVRLNADKELWIEDDNTIRAMNQKELYELGCDDL